MSAPAEWAIYMKNFFKKILLLFLGLFIFIIPFSVKAQLDPSLKMQIEVQPMLVSKKVGIGEDLSDTEAVLVEKIGGYIGIAIGLIGTVALAFVIYGGFLWITAKGNAEQLTQARKMITNSVIAVIIVGFSYLITAFATSILIASVVDAV